MDKKRILVIDDEPYIPRILEYNFKKEENWVGVSVPDKNTALKKLREGKFDLVILDVKLPLLKNGLDTFHQIRENYKEIPIIILSVAADKPPVIDLDADVFILKPFEFKKLHAKIKELLK